MADESDKWVTKVTGVTGSRIDFRHNRLVPALGGFKYDICSLAAFINFGDDQKPQPFTVYSIEMHGTVIGHAEYAVLNKDNLPNWEIDLFNVARGRC